MRHRRKGRYLGNSGSHRRALLRNLVSDLILHDRIRTTSPKAKEARTLADKVVTLARRGGLHERRRCLQLIHHPGAVARLFRDVAPRFNAAERHREKGGGYTRIITVGERQGDNALMVLWELSVLPEAPKAQPGEDKAAAAKKGEGSAAGAAGDPTKPAKPAKPVKPAKAAREARPGAAG